MIGGGAIKVTLEGSSMRVVARLKNPDGTYVAPAQVRLVVKPPSSADSIVYASSAIGDARVGVIEADEPGTWRYRFESLANPLAAYERLFFVMRRRVPRPISAPYIVGGQAFTFSELLPVGTKVMTIAIGGGAATGFAITGGNPGGVFVVNNLGEVRIAVALSAAALNFYNLQVTASNRAGVSPAVGLAFTITGITPQVVVVVGFEAVGAVGALITNTGALVVPAGVAGAGAFGVTGSGLPAPSGAFLSEDGNFYFVAENDDYFAQESIGFAGVVGVSGAMTGGTVTVVLPGEALAQPGGVQGATALGTTTVVGRAVVAAGGVTGAGAVGTADAGETGVGFSAETGDNVVLGMAAWVTATVITPSTYGSKTGAFRTNAGKLYYSAAGGTTGGTAPTHTSGTVNDGGVSWLFCCVVDWTTLASWTAALPLTLSAPEVGIIWADAEHTISAVVNWGTHNTDAVNNITLKAKEELAFYAHAASVLRYDPTKGVAIRMTVNYTNIFTTGNVANYSVVKGLQLKSPDGRLLNLFGNNTLVDRCLLEKSGYSSALLVGGDVRNCIVIIDNDNTATRPIDIEGASRKITNCTIVRPSNRTAGGVALRANYGSLHVKNCIVAGFTTAPEGTVTGDHNASTNATAIPSGTGDVVISNPATEFVQSSSGSGVHDFRLVTGSVSRNAGIAAPTENPAGIDIIGTARSDPPDIGAHEFA